MIVKFKKPLLATLIVVLIVAAGINGYFIGTRNPRTIIVKGIDNIEGGKIKNADFGTVWQTIDLLKKHHLKADKIDNQELVYGAAAGVAASLKDPYTVFLKPEDSKRFTDDIRGKFGGIGAEIGIRGEFISIIAPLEGSPAEKAGIMAGDKILAVNASTTINMTLNDAVKKIRGPRGSKVTLTVLRNGDEKTRDITITRGIIKIPTIKWEMKEGKIAHVQLFNFNEIAPKVFPKAFNEALRAGAKGFILDLRNNPGGFLEVAVSLTGIFVESGKTVVIEEFSSGKRNTFTAKGQAALKDFPLVILINKGSASASEIMAGAIRDNNGTTIIGENSFGKGTVQELKKLSDGSTLKITIARWLLPNGSVIEKNGIKPDVEVKITEEDAENKKDTQLEKALEILQKEMQNKSQ
jgi:carboxyl-terminal processing protease